MTLDTHTQPSTASIAPSAKRATFFQPAGMADLPTRSLYREFLRWPTVLWLPATVAILTVVGLHSYVAAVPCAILLATAATLAAVRRACARLAPRYDIPEVSGLIPFQRSGELR